MTKKSATAGVSPIDQDTINRVNDAHKKLKDAKQSLKTVMQGQDELIDLALATVISGAGGHILFEGAPGTGKTTLVKHMAEVLNLTTKRIQCTPDLMPSDVLGSYVEKINEETGKPYLEFVNGPALSAQVLFIDEINRANPKTQSALLQLMQEGYATIEGKKVYAPVPFIVAATQNPFDAEGTNPLPQAQYDRFRTRPIVDNVDKDTDLAIGERDQNKPGETAALYAMANDPDVDLTVRAEKEELSLDPVLGKNDIILYQKLVRDMPISPELNAAIVNMMRFARPKDEEAPEFIKTKFNSGTDGHRTGQALRAMVRANALIRGGACA
ncbi:MAG: MoxR family ATPase [Alphaproteobacteria bacterium]|nr:MoxR family ATPase [Alphaproteobacteria bacterium]